MSQNDFFKMVANEENQKTEFFNGSKRELPPEEKVHEYMYRDIAVEINLDGTARVDAKQDQIKPWNHTATIGDKTIMSISVIDRSKCQIIARIKFD